MRIYGNGILKTRSVLYRLLEVYRYHNAEHHADEIAVHVTGTHGEALDMHLSLKTARALVDKLEAALHSAVVASEVTP